MLKFLIEAFKASKGRMPNNLEMILLRQKATNQAIDERKIVNIFDRKPVNPNKPILGGKNIPETEDDIRRRLLKNNEEGIASIKSKLEDPEKKANGGRAGFKGGGSDASTTSFSKSYDKQHGTNTASRANKSVDRRQAAGQRDADNTNRRMEANRQAGLSEIFPPKETIREKIENSPFNNSITRGLFRAGLYTLNPSLGVLDARQAMQLKNAYDLAVTGSLPNTDKEEETMGGGITEMDSSMLRDSPYENIAPQFMATGGRTGYKLGTGKKGVEGLIDLIRNKFGKKSITTADKAPIPTKTLERNMFEKTNERFKNKRMLDDDEYQDFLDEVGGADQLEAYDFDGTAGSAKRILKEQKQYMDDMELEYRKGNLDPVAGDKSPARKRFLQQKFDEMESSGDPKLMTRDEIEELTFFDMGTEMDEAKSLAPKMVERLQLKQKYPGIGDDLLDKILIDDNVQRKAEVLATMDEAFKMMEKGKSPDEIIETFKNVTRTKQADGGRIGLKSGSYLYKKFKDLGLGKLFTSDKVAGVTMGEEGIAELLRLLSGSGMFADGGRAGFMAGGMGRRAFLKLLGSAGAGIAGAKTGLMSLAKKSEPVVEAVKETAQGVPPYFFKLVEKIKKFGDDVTGKSATQEREIVTEYKDFRLTEDIATGEKTIQRQKVRLDDDAADYYGKPLTEETYMNYKPGKGQADEMTGPIPDEYEEGTAFLRNDKEFAGDIVDESFKISDDVIEEAMKETPSIKKASGGIARMLGE